MSSFWDALRYGVPTVGSVGAFAMARSKGWKVVGSVLAAGGGWVGGYLVYRLVSKISESHEGLPEETTLPMYNITDAPPTVDGVMHEVQNRQVDDASYEPSVRGFDGQPKTGAVVIDMTKTAPTPQSSAPPPQAPAPQASQSPKPPGRGFNPNAFEGGGLRPFNPGGTDPFGSAGSRGSI